MTTRAAHNFSRRWKRGVSTAVVTAASRDMTSRRTGGSARSGGRRGDGAVTWRQLGLSWQQANGRRV